MPVILCNRNLTLYTDKQLEDLRDLSLHDNSLAPCQAAINGEIDRRKKNKAEKGDVFKGNTKHKSNEYPKIIHSKGEWDMLKQILKNKQIRKNRIDKLRFFCDCT